MTIAACLILNYCVRKTSLCCLTDNIWNQSVAARNVVLYNLCLVFTVSYCHEMLSQLTQQICNYKVTVTCTGLTIKIPVWLWQYSTRTRWIAESVQCSLLNAAHCVGCIWLYVYANVCTHQTRMHCRHHNSFACQPSLQGITHHDLRSAMWQATKLMKYHFQGWIRSQFFSWPPPSTTIDAQVMHGLCACF